MHEQTEQDKAIGKTIDKLMEATEALANMREWLLRPPTIIEKPDYIQVPHSIKIAEAGFSHNGILSAAGKHVLWWDGDVKSYDYTSIKVGTGKPIQTHLEPAEWGNIKVGEMIYISATCNKPEGIKLLGNYGIKTSDTGHVYHRSDKNKPIGLIHNTICYIFRVVPN